MYFIQYKNLLKLRGIIELPSGKSIQDMVDKTGGEPTVEEMNKVNEISIKDLINKQVELEEQIKLFEKERLGKDNTIKELENKINHLNTPTSIKARENYQLSSEDEKRLMLLNALENAGVDNWDGYSFAIDQFNEMIGESQE